jgi:LURP-one-related
MTDVLLNDAYHNQGISFSNDERGGVYFTNSSPYATMVEFFSSSLEPPRAPVYVTGDRFVLPHEVQFKLKSKFFMQNDFNVTNSADGLTYLKVDKKFFNWHGKRVLLDVQGTPVCNITSKWINIWTKFIISRGSGSHELARVKRKAFTFMNREKMYLEFSNKTNGETVKVTSI